jgi:hypothetical protein
VLPSYNGTAVPLRTRMQPLPSFLSSYAVYFRHRTQCRQRTEEFAQLATSFRCNAYAITPIDGYAVFATGRGCVDVQSCCAAYSRAPSEQNRPRTGAAATGCAGTSAVNTTFTLRTPTVFAPSWQHGVTCSIYALLLKRIGAFASTQFRVHGTLVPPPKPFSRRSAVFRRRHALDIEATRSALSLRVRTAPLRDSSCNAHRAHRVTLRQFLYAFFVRSHHAIVNSMYGYHA